MNHASYLELLGKQTIRCRGFEIYMLLAGWEVRIVKNWTDPKPVNNLFIFFQALKRKKNSQKINSRKRYCDRVRDRKIRTALRTNQIAGFVTVSARKKIKLFIKGPIY